MTPGKEFGPCLRGSQTLHWLTSRAETGPDGLYMVEGDIYREQTGGRVMIYQVRDGEALGSGSSHGIVGRNC